MYIHHDPSDRHIRKYTGNWSEVYIEVEVTGVNRLNHKRSK